MSRSLLGCFIALLIAGGIAATVSAKGVTVKLTITGPGLSRPIDVTTAGAVSANVWGGEFLGRPAPEPPRILPRYAVAFHVSLPRDQGIKLMYVVYYARDPFSGEGFVYLPGRGEEWSQLNRSTMLREGQDGRWHYATKKWSNAIAVSLP